MGSYNGKDAVKKLSAKLQSMSNQVSETATYVLMGAVGRRLKSLCIINGSFPL